MCGPRGRRLGTRSQVLAGLLDGDFYKCLKDNEETLLKSSGGVPSDWVDCSSILQLITEKSFGQQQLIELLINQAGYINGSVCYAIKVGRFAGKLN